MDIQDKIKELDDRLSRLEKIELGDIAPDLPIISNDPTEIEYARKITPAEFQALTEVPHQLHEFRNTADERAEDRDLVCQRCGVSISDCGATSESWYCV